MRTRTFSQSAACRVWQTTWAPRCLMIPLQLYVEVDNFTQVSGFTRYLWVFFWYQFDCAQRHTDHGIADVVGTRILRTASPGSPQMCFYVWRNANCEQTINANLTTAKRLYLPAVRPHHKIFLAAPISSMGSTVPDNETSSTSRAEISGYVWLLSTYILLPLSKNIRQRAC